ncbi:MAG: ABC transporter permease subunit [Actinobacteria bacterium]|nr:ABC transporter permease subunit [Actinomycetota bacterium]
MFKAELYKIRSHRTPTVLAGVLAIAVLIPSAVLVWYSPANTTAYTSIYSTIFAILTVLLGIVFGGWILGTEYRQDTVKRMLTAESRRGRALASKAAVGAGAMITVMAATALVGYGAARLVGSLNDVSVAFEGRTLLGYGVAALLSAVIAFGLSALTRSDSFAMIGTIALVLVLDPLLRIVPWIGKYSYGNAVGVVTEQIQGAASGFGEPATTSLTVAIITLATWLTASVATGAIAFARRDV